MLTINLIRKPPTSLLLQMQQSLVNVGVFWLPASCYYYTVLFIHMPERSKNFLGWTKHDFFSCGSDEIVCISRVSVSLIKRIFFFSSVKQKNKKVNCEIPANKKLMANVWLQYKSLNWSSCIQLAVLQTSPFLAARVTGTRNLTALGIGLGLQTGDKIHRSVSKRINASLSTGI